MRLSKFWANLPIRSKLLLSFSLIALVLLVSIVYSVFSLQKLRSSFDVLQNENRNLDSYTRVEVLNKKLNISARNFLLAQDPKWEDQYNDLNAQFDAEIEKAKQFGEGSLERDKIEELDNLGKKTKGAELLALLYAREGKAARAIELFDTNYYERQSEFSDILTGLVLDGADKVKGIINENNQQLNFLVILFVAAFGAELLFLVFIAFWTANNLSSRLTGLVAITRRLAQGEMTVRVNEGSTDEVGQLGTSFNEMANELEKSYNQLKQTLEEVRKEHARLQASIDSLNVGFFLVDPQMELVMINPVAKHLFCFADENPGSAGVITSQQMAKFECRMADIEKNLQGTLDIRSQIKESITAQKRVEIKELSFKNRFLHIFIAPIVVLEGKLQVIGAVVLVEDITEAKLLARSRDEFFSIASHELRTPLTAIRGNSSMIQEYYAADLKEPELKEMITDINESSVRLIAIVNDFLDVSRLELGKIEFKKEQLELVPLVTDTIQEYITTGSMKNLYVKMEEVKTLLPRVLADGDRVKQVLINLIGNGIKFTQKGGVTVKLTQMDGFVNVAVSDTGKGIPAENQKLLFRKFQQAGASLYTREASLGTGLGLYISKMLIEGMGGTIKLESSTAGQGSTFAFTLPVAPAGSPPASSQQATAPTSGADGQKTAVLASVK